MQEAYLKKIRDSIRKNWGQVKPFKKIPKDTFNCYMFAVCDTETVGNYSRFGGVGRISGTKYQNINEYKQALINDLNVLGIYAEECSEDPVVTGDTIKIAFFSNFKEGMTVQEEFHFLRFINSKKRWMGKAGYPGGFQKMPRNHMIDKIRVIDQKRIGIFKLSLKDES